MLKFITFLSLLLGVLASDELSPCLKECLFPLARLHMSNSDIFLKYDEICATLEPAAECARRCSQLAHAQFHQLSANFRLHCLEFEEELEDHLSCLQEHTVEAEKNCQAVCKVDEENVADKQLASCKQNECNMKCHFKGLIKGCPDAEKTLKKINIQKAKELEALRGHENFKLLPLECQQLHDHLHVQRVLEEL